MSRSLSPKERELSHMGSDAFDALWAILNAYVPADLLPAVNEYVQVVESLGFLHCFEGERMLYAKLCELLPDNVTQVRQAYQATVLDGCEEDWIGYGVPLYYPPLRLVE
jgi:hypothetical protein